MRRYLFSTGLLGAIVGGLTLLRGLRDREDPFTWRTALAWVSWGITATLAIGATVDTYRAGRGRLAPSDSPVSGKEQRLLRRRLER